MRGSLEVSSEDHLASSRLALLFILIFQATISLLLLHNTAFEDEALYMFAGRQIIAHWRDYHVMVDGYGFFFSGYPNLHPVIAGMLDMIGGVEAARMLSLALMLAVTACVFWTTQVLIDDASAMLAALLFSFQGSVLFLGRLATHDSLCFMLLAAATVLALLASATGALWQACAMGALLALSMASKYAGLLFVPSIFALLIWRGIHAQGKRVTLTMLGASVCSLLLTSVVVYQFSGEGVAQGFYTTTLHRVVSGRAPLAMMLDAQFKWGGLIFILGLIGLAMKGMDLGTGLLLFATSLLAPVFHLAKGEMVSMHKHIAFALFFMMPLAGYAVARLVFHGRSALGALRLAGFAICLFALITGARQAYILYHGWSSSSELIGFLRTQVRPGNDRYLAEEFNVARYYLADRADPNQWTSLDYFVYTDKQGQHHSGKDAYVSAINDEYFELIELNFGARAAVAEAIDQAIRSGGEYALVTRTYYPNSYGPGYFWIWRRKPKPSG